LVECKAHEESLTAEICDLQEKIEVLQQDLNKKSSKIDVASEVRTMLEPNLVFSSSVKKIQNFSFTPSLLNLFIAN